MPELKSYVFYIDGKWEEPDEGQQIPSWNLATGQPWAEFAAASEDQCNRAVAAAHPAFGGEWSRMSAADRLKTMRKLAELLPNDAEKLAHAETRSGMRSPRISLP